MLIYVADLNDGHGLSTCALNLACALAGTDTLSVDRWKGAHRVVLFDADPGRGTATHYGGHLPVSREYLPLGESTIELWMHRILAIAAEVDYLVVDSSPHFDGISKAIVGISDLVVVSSSGSSADLTATASMVEFIGTTRLARPDGGPKCLLVPTRPTSGTTHGDEIAEALRKFGEPIGPVIFPRAKFEDAFAGRWIGDFAHFSPAHGAITALAARVESMLMKSEVTEDRCFPPAEGNRI
jgi:cellulose biosynthesis protein BcsQ